VYVATTATRKLLKLRKRIKLVPGGMSAGKTVAILQILVDKEQSDATPKLTSVVSETMPHLKKGAIRDFKSLLREHNYWDPDRWNATDFIYTFETGSQLEFFSADMPSKVHGPRRDRLFVNEANHIRQETWEQLLFRTREEAWADWNPVTDFYMYEDYGINDENVPATATDDRVDVCVLTYRDNEALEPALVHDIELKAASNKQWGRVYAEGKRGEVEGKVYTGWQMIDTIPHEARLERRGLDFGYTNDPSALVDIYYYNGGYIWDERLYRKGMSNKDIADFLKNLEKPNTLVVADSAEPKSIAELKLYGINILPAQKGPGSVMQGVQYVQDQRMSITKRSVNGLREYRGHMFKTDRDGKILNVPEDFDNHFLDAGRYGMESLRPREVVAPLVPGWVQRARAQR
jgi:phage terminase large subunit